VAEPPQDSRAIRWFSGLVLKGVTDALSTPHSNHGENGRVEGIGPGIWGMPKPTRPSGIGKWNCVSHDTKKS
jgi:hypothetical protein